MKEESEKGLVGRPTKLTEEISADIIASVRRFLSINNAAEVNGVPRATVTTWMRHGNLDFDNEEDSIFARFTQGIKKARAEKVQDYLGELELRQTNWQSIAWTLERCCAEDFGKDAELYRQLLDDYKMLMQSIVDQNNGVTHGRKVDPKVD